MDNSIEKPDIPLSQEVPGRLSTGQRVAKNALVEGFGEITRRLISFVYVIYVARILGVEGFGQIGWVKAFISYFFMVLNGGLDMYAIREVARNKSRIPEWVSHILSIRIVLSSLLYVVMVGLSFFVSKSVDVKFLLLIYSLCFFVSAFSLGWVFSGIEKMEYNALSTTLTSLISLVGVLLFLHRPDDILKVPVIDVVGSLVVAVGLIFVYTKKFGRPRFAFDFTAWKKIIKSSAPIGLSIIMTQLYINIDLVMIGVIKGMRSVGWYESAYKIVGALSCFGTIHLAAFFPVISRYYKHYADGKERIRTLLTLSLKIICLFALPMVVMGFFVAEPLILLFFGEAFLPGAVAFQILVLSAAVIWIGVHFGKALIACDDQKKYLWAVCAGGITNIVLNFIFIPRYGFIAASVTTVVSEFVVLCMMKHHFKRVTDIRLLPLLKKPFVSALIMAGVMFLFRDAPIGVLLSLGIVVYGAVIVLLKGMDRSDIRFIRDKIFLRKSFYES